MAFIPRSFLTLLLFSLCTIVPYSATAQTSADELARRHFESGAAYLEQAEYEAALREFLQAYELSQRPEILINVATVHERLDQVPQAIEALQRYLAQAPQGDHAESVRIRVDNLKGRQERDEAQAASTTSATPTASSEAAPAPAPASSSQPVAASDHAVTAPPNRVPAYVLFGVAGATAAGSLITGLLANGEYNAAQDSCAPTCSDQALSSGRTLAVTSTVLTGAAVLSAGIGALLFFKPWGQDADGTRSDSPAIGIGFDAEHAMARSRWRF